MLRCLTQVAERLGVRSLRRQMLAETAAGMQLGFHAPGAEAFGQVWLPGSACPACTRLPHQACMQP